MQQISWQISSQLKCYGRRNRAKPEPSSVESGPPLVKDVRGLTPVKKVSPTPTSDQAVDVFVAQVKKPHAGRGRPRKVVGVPKQGVKSLSDVVTKKMPATRSSAGKPVAFVASDGREVAKDSISIEETVPEGSSLKTLVRSQDKVPVRVRIVGPFSNGGSKHGRDESFGSLSSGSQKSRGQIVRQEAQRAADDETSDGLQPNQRKSDGLAARDEKISCRREIERSSIHEKKVAEEQVIDKREEGQTVPEKKRTAHFHYGRKDAVEQVIDKRNQWLPVTERKMGGKTHHDIHETGEQVIHKRGEGRYIFEMSAGGKSQRERIDGEHSTRGKHPSASEGTLASRRRFMALRRRQREDLLLSRADEILLKQEFLEANKDKKVQPKSKKPARPKTHWDFVIEEMTWLAKDFERERKWKLTQAKKIVLRVNRSKLDVVARGNRRLKEEEQRMRRVASNIAKDVKKFWLKVDKLVSYKQQLLVEERKKKALDKHLDFLLGQTERYSTMLAENLADNTTAHEPQSHQPFPSLCKEVSSTDIQVLSVLSEQINVSGEAEKLEGAVRMEVEGDDEFIVEDKDEQEDDEATLEADEALITEEERKEELLALQIESELPLEDLLIAYKLMRGDSASEAGDDEDKNGETDQEDDDDKEEKVVEGPTYVTPVEESKKGTSAAAHDIGSLGQPDSVEGCLGSSDDGPVDVNAAVPQLLGKKEKSSEVGAVDKALLSDEAPAVLLGSGEIIEVDMAGPVVDLVASETDENLAKLVVGVTHRNTIGAFLTQVKPQKRRHLSPKSLQHQIGELQDDNEYIPALLGDEDVEDDDERTLEEEERIAMEEGDRNINEINELKLESEMPLEELLAKYRCGMDFDGEDTNDFSVDRRDRTSEAGISGSSSDDEDDERGVNYFSEAIERMGEPSTSGRDYQRLSSTEVDREMNNFNVINTVEVKQEVVEAKLFDNNVGDFQKVDVHGRVLHPDAQSLSRDDVLVSGSNKDVSSSTSLLLGGDIFDVLEETAIPKTIETKESSAAEDALSLPAISSVVNEDSRSVFGIPTSDPVKSGNMLGDRGLACDLQSLAVGRVQKSDSNIQSKPECTTSIICHETPNEVQSTEVKDQVPALPETLDVGENKKSEDRLADYAAAAQSAQPTGYTFSTTQVKTKLPFLLKHSLREYQHIGLDWLVTMYEKRLNGILADEMGLGKTIMTIALLAHLACEKGVWGPHLIVVPTSVMLNWETEFMKWCPAFKILTYFGNAKERKLKRQGWSRPNSFHVCITTYRLVIQDAKAFKRKKWKYLILDEAHLIKNWKSQRWQTLLNFNSKRRILLTGTPLQNDLMELWSLMHFLMPHVFQSHQEFRDWFCNPITGMVEGEDQVNKELVDRLHNVLRPFLLRRLKKDVEKQLPGKFEHVIRCRLSKRQRNLYEDFMASSDTQATLSSGNFFGLINVLMQLRKVCNHPDLFEGRPIVSSFDMTGIKLHLSSAACSATAMGPFDGIDLGTLNLQFSRLSGTMTKWEAHEVGMLKAPGPLIVELAGTGEDTWDRHQSKHKPSKEVRTVIQEIHSSLRDNRERQRRERLLAISVLNEFRCNQQPLYGADFLKSAEIIHPVYDVHKVNGNPRQYLEFSSILSDIVQLPLTRCESMIDLITAFVFAIPAARAPHPVAWCSHLIPASIDLKQSISEEVLQRANSMLVPLRPVFVRKQLFFPDRRLLQFDCGKLQELAVLLRRLKSQGHRALIFTQMTKMLDVLESFINLYGYTYMRLDGSTKPEQRQVLMQRFNTNPKIFLFILSTRSGGVGINLVGADTVIFYDSDWNPAMDLQAQDRCHRIGQTREVHIYRLISESTIEENILKKANQKRILDDLVIQSGSYNTEFFKKLDPMELFSGLKEIKVRGTPDKKLTSFITSSIVSEITDAPFIKVFEQKELSNAEVDAALKNAEDEADYMAMKRVEQEEAAENQEFTEELFAGNVDEEDLADDLDESGKSRKLQTDIAGVDGSRVGERAPEDGGTAIITEVIPFGEFSILPADPDEEMDMLADVRQMAAAAAASGRGSISFEDQLRPVERYAMRFLELWDPRVDSMAVVAQVAFEEKEWELDQLEKLKEEQEAEMDEDNEPLFYETWDTALADEAYRQQVDILAQQQEQKQLEWEAMEEEMRDTDRALAEAAATVRGAENFTLKSKGKKKLKKAKFKTLAEGSLMTGTEDISIREEFQVDRSSDPSYRDQHSDMMLLPHRSLSQRKRKAPMLLKEEVRVEAHTKKLKKNHFGKDRRVAGEKGQGKQRTLEDNIFRTIFGISNDHKSSGSTLQESVDQPGGLSNSGVHGGTVLAGKDKRGKLTILGMPPKKGPLIMLEKERKKDSLRSQDHLPPASPWTHGEDAVLCAVVHEYGGNWQLASDALAGGPDGGVYRGRHRHPVYCRERFRELLAQNAAAASGDPVSERSALSAATNAQLKVTEEHTKRLLNAVLQLPDKELLLQRHFVAALAAVEKWRKVAAKHGSEKLLTSATTNSPSGRSFVPLRSLLKSPSLLTKAGAGMPSPRQVSTALAQLEKGTKVLSNQTLAKPHRKEQVSEDSSLRAEIVNFNITQYLVGSREYGESSAKEGEPNLRAQGVSVPITFEALGFPSLSSSPPRLTSKAVRHLADILVENRFRFATKIGWDGATRDWAAAGGSGTGVLGLHIPTKGKGGSKKRHIFDSNKTPKAKLLKTSKFGVKKGLTDSTFNQPACGPVVNADDFNSPSGHDVEMKVKVALSGTSSGRNLLLLQKTGVKRIKKKAMNSASSVSPPAPGHLDLNVQQPDALVLNIKVCKKVKKSSSGVVPGAIEIAHKMAKKSPKKLNSLSKPLTNPEAGVGSPIGLGLSGGSPSRYRAFNGDSTRNNLSPGRGIDLNGSSDEDVTIVGISAGTRYNLLHSQVPAPFSKPGTSRHFTKKSEISSAARSNIAGLERSVELDFLGSRLSVKAFESLNNEDSSLASHLMNILTCSPAQDLLAFDGVPEGLSRVQWPPAPGGWPVSTLNDLDLPIDLSSPSFSEGKQKSAVALPFRSSSPGQAGRSLGKESSLSVSRLQMTEGTARMVNLQEEPDHTPTWSRETQSNSQSQEAARYTSSSHPPGGSDRPRKQIRFSPCNPVRPMSETGSSLLHHASPSRSLKAPSHIRHPSSSQTYQPGAFPEVVAQSFQSLESPVDTGLEIPFGLSVLQKLSAGARLSPDLQSHNSPP